jgi:hypothetical protein
LSKKNQIVNKKSSSVDLMKLRHRLIESFEDLKKIPWDNYILEYCQLEEIIKICEAIRRLDILLKEAD